WPGPPARQAGERLLAGAVDLLAASHNPGGCLVVQGALACGEAAESVRRELVAVRAAGLDLIRKRLERARRDGDLPEGVDCADLARYLMTVVHGLAVQAAGGAARQALEGAAQPAPA